MFVIACAILSASDLRVGAATAAVGISEDQESFTLTNGIGGYWSEHDLAFDAATMHAGQNVMKLAIPAGSLASGIEYDYLRLEWDESAAPPGPADKK
jgi:hypothetical protein